jgi:stearoyl-CoA desaturase (delta-9 desaturase)
MKTLRLVAYHVNKLKNNGTLIQAVGVPLRHFFAFYGIWLCLRGAVGWRTYLWTFSLWPFAGLGVTVGAHRLWTHQSFKPHWIMEAILICMYSCADQGPISGWSLTHALHHRASDTPQDPHNRQAGFWHSHLGWLFSSQSFHVSPEDYNRVIKGLSKMVVWHDNWAVFFDPLWSLVIPSLVASLWGEAWAGFFVAGALRWMFVQHVTFFVNSVAHGEREEGDRDHLFDGGASGIGPRVSLLVTILALGEGWHDYHHIFPWDYATAELGAWDQWNPSKVFIDAFANLGLCDSRRRCSEEMQVARRLHMLGLGGSGPLPVKTADYYSIKGNPFLRYRCPKPVLNAAAEKARSCPREAGTWGVAPLNNGSLKAD